MFWYNSMIRAGLEPREKSYEDLIEHLDKLVSSLPDNPIPNKYKIKDASPDTTSIIKKDKKDKKRVKFGKETRGYP